MSELTTRATGSDPRVGAGGGRLAAAFDSVSKLPALAEARRRLLRLCESEAATPAEIAEAVESDIGLTIAVMRAANNGSGPSGRAGGVLEAIESLRPEAVGALAGGVKTYDVLDHPGPRSNGHERFRRHAVAVRNSAERIGAITKLPRGDELALAALLHDVGKLVLVELYGDRYRANGRPESPRERVRGERRELGIDHALVGAVLIRRWGLGGVVAAAVERHHAPDADGHAAAIRLADLIAHQAAGEPIAANTLREAAAALAIDERALSSLLFDFPHGWAPRRRASQPCPLSMREVDALRGLAEGKVYKQIAQELSLSVSTVRTHLHNVYRKIGAVDRAQAVLIASDRGWL
ncbi:MAG: HDOD domain-containing protein [Solirubrobacterales bacterium]